MKFRPALIPTVFVAIGVAILVNLALWQLRRNEETSARVARIESRVDDPPLTALDAAPEALSWHRADLSGRFADAEPMLVTGRFEFGDVGFDVVQVFEVDGGPRLLVNRGWIPRDGWEATLRDIAPGAGPTRVEGLLLDVEELGGDPELRPIPAADGLPERWPMNPYVAMVKEVGDVTPVVLFAGEQLESDQAKSQAALPVTGYRAKPHVSPHLEYAGTWGLIAVTLITIWVVAGFRRGAAA